MPELPDVTIYIECLTPRTAGRRLERLRLVSPFLLRTIEPPPEEAEGKMLLGLWRLGKQIVFALEGDILRRAGGNLFDYCMRRLGLSEGWRRTVGDDRCDVPGCRGPGAGRLPAHPQRRPAPRPLPPATS